MAQNRKFSIIRAVELSLQSLLLLILIAQLILLKCVISYGYIPLPAKRINSYLATHSIQELRLAASSYKLRLNGQIEAFGLQLFRANNKKPILFADNARLDWRIQTKRKPRLQFTGFVLSGGILYQPAVHSPDGTHASLLKELAIDLEIQDDNIVVNALCAKLEDWILRGSVHLPQPIATTEMEESNHPLDSFYRLAAEVLTLKKDHEYLKNPTVAFNLSSNDFSKTDIELLLSTESIAYSNTNIEDATLELHLVLNDKRLSLHKPALLTGSQMDLPSLGLTATDASCWIEPHEINELFEQRLPQIDFSARNIQHEDYKLDQPLFQISEITQNQIELSGSVSWSGSVSEIKGNYNPKGKSGQLEASGKLNTTAVLQTFPLEILEEFPPLELPVTLPYTAEVVLLKDHQLNKVEFSIHAENTRIGDLVFDAIHSKGRYQNKKFQIDALQAYREHQYVSAFAEIDTTEKELLILARGNIQPKEYNKILPLWWSGIFRDFSLSPQSIVNADFAVRSAYERKTGTHFFGKVRLQDVAYSSVPLEEAHILVKGNPLHIHLDISEVNSSAGSFSGNINLTRRQDGIPSLLGLHLNVETELSISATKDLIGDLLYRRIVGDFTFTNSPKIQLQGSSYFTRHYPEYRGKNHFSFQADANGPLEYCGTPLEYLQFHGYSDDTVTQLRNITFGYADGSGKGAIDIWSRKGKAGIACVELHLHDADDRKAIKNLPVLDPLENDFKTPLEIESKVPSKSGSGSLNAYLHVCGPLDEPYGYSGNASFTIRDKQLGAIQLLGPLSMLLQGTALGFTSFELNEMSAKMAIDQEIAHFTELQVDGPLTKIEATGSMKLESQALDMRVAVHLFGNTTNRKNPITKITDIVNPLSALLRFELGGTLEKQRWRSIYDPRNLIPGL